MIDRFLLKVIPSSKQAIIIGPTNFEYQGSHKIINESGQMRIEWEEEVSYEQSTIRAGIIIKETLAKKYNINVNSVLDNDKVKCEWVGLSSGLGEPCFDKVQAVLCKELMKIKGAIGFEVGSGFDGVLMRGSEHNDRFYMEEGHIKTRSNHAGGVLGGITTGMPVYFSVIFESTEEMHKDLIESISAIIFLDFILVQASRTNNILK
jgi:hypothetical protein